MASFKDSLRIKIDPELAKELNALMKAEPWRDRGSVIRQLLYESIAVRKAKRPAPPRPVVPKSS